MDEERLRHFFTMHGENLERRAGRIGRGKWGTGKSAAFGIANALTVDTVRGGLRNVVELTRSAIQSSDGNNVPLDWKVLNEPTTAPNGTTITIQEVLLPRIDKGTVIEYIERNLAAFRGVNPSIAVNSHICEYQEPPIRDTFSFEPTSEQAKVMGYARLNIFTSGKPLSDWEQGIAVQCSEGNLVAIERGGIERKEFGNYIFGDIDVPALETFETPLEPFDPSRSLMLNPRHPVVAVLLGFIGSKLEQVRLDMVAKEKAAKQREESRRLARHADSLAEMLNHDFASQIQRLSDIRSATSRTGPAQSLFGATASGDTESDAWIEGLLEPGNVEDSKGGERKGASGGRQDPAIPRAGIPKEDGDEVVSPAGGEGRTSRPRGGFHVDFRNLGSDEDRSVYDSNEMTIIINLDHPVVEAALSNEGLESISFQRLSYEIAFSEYAIALSNEIVNRDPAMPADDVLYDIRATLKRITRAAAPLYASR
jgi:hypothetical protein